MLLRGLMLGLIVPVLVVVRLKVPPFTGSPFDRPGCYAIWAGRGTGGEDATGTEPHLGFELKRALVQAEVFAAFRCT